MEPRIKFTNAARSASHKQRRFQVTDAPDDSDRLKLCPFCRGSASLQIISEGPNVGGHYISCDKCGASTSIVFACGDDPIPLLMEMWNKRDETANHESHFRIKELEAQVEALRKDAERYRWLRIQPNDTSAPRLDIVRWTASDESANEGEGLRFERADEAIDEAMKGQS